MERNERRKIMKIAIIGTGVYSTALTYHLQKMKDNDIYLWTEKKELANQFKKQRKFEMLSKNIKFDSNIFVTDDFETTLKDASAIFILVGSKYFLNTLEEIKPHYKKNTPIFVGTKGMDLENQKFYSDITRKYLKCNSYAFFAGPTFAKDLIQDYPFALTFACSNSISYKKLERILPEYVDTECTYDLYGLEIMAVLKNIYAIGGGILNGLKVTDSVKYTYLTKVLKECQKILKKCHGNNETIISYGGIGDFFMTTNSKTSRNFTLGKLIGSKSKKSEIEEFEKKNTIEGLESLKQSQELIKKWRLQNTILNELYEIIINKRDPKELAPKIKEKSETF